FQPYLLQLATQMGMENSDYFKEETQRQTEKMLVDAYYADSVERKVKVTPQERARYYDKHKNYYFTYTREHLFVFYRPKDQAEAFADSLRRGLLKPRDVVRQDSLLHLNRRLSEERITWAKDPNDVRVVFNEMKDGQVRVIPHDPVSTVVLRVEQIPGHQLTLQEVDTMIDDSLRAEKSEALLQSLLARLRKRYPVKLYTDSLMDIDGTPI